MVSRDIDVGRLFVLESDGLSKGLVGQVEANIKPTETLTHGSLVLYEWMAGSTQDMSLPDCVACSVQRFHL